MDIICKNLSLGSICNSNYDTLNDIWLEETPEARLQLLQ